MWGKAESGGEQLALLPTVWKDGAKWKRNDCYVEMGDAFSASFQLIRTNHRFLGLVLWLSIPSSSPAVLFVPISLCGEPFPTPPPEMHDVRREEGVFHY